MSSSTDLLLLAVVVCDLLIVATSRVQSCVRASAFMGIALGLLPLSLWFHGPGGSLAHVIFMSAGTLVLKALLIPRLLARALHTAQARREVEPFISLHASLIFATVLVGVSFWLANALPLPRAAPSALLLPVAFATLLLGFLVLVSRRKAITQIVGYLMIENGVFVFGQTLTKEMPLMVELGIFLDLLVGVFVMGIAIYHISQEFDDIDTELLSSLKD